MIIAPFYASRFETWLLPEVLPAMLLDIRTFCSFLTCLFFDCVNDAFDNDFCLSLWDSLSCRFVFIT